MSTPLLRNDTALVTGAAQGIGQAIAPGAVPSAGFKGSPGLAEKIALKRLGRPEDIAPMAVAILSEKYGAYVTGATVVVDGGIALYNWLDAAT